MKLMKQTLRTVTAAAIAALLGSGIAWAGNDQTGKINVTSCISTPSGQEVAIRSYDADDGVDLVAHQTKTIGVGETKDLKCDGAGKGRCTLKVTFYV